MKQSNIIIIYLFIAFIGMTLLAGSIEDLKFRPGLPIPGAKTTNSIPASSPSEVSNPIYKTGMNLIILKIGIVMSFLFLSISIIHSLFQKSNKKKISMLLLGVIALFLIIDILHLFVPEISSGEDNTPIENNSLTTINYDVVPLDQPPNELVWIVGIGILIGIISFGIFIFFRKDPNTIKENALLNEIDSALYAIQDGKEMSNIIIECYLKLNEIIKEEYQIEREKSLTPREFETLLRDKEIPSGPIHQMTTIFEKVRYGNKLISSEDERNVISSLNEIRISCQHYGKMVV